MNQGKIWLVVKPTIGLPLFLGGVTVIALAVHAAILTNTDWYPAYYSGKAKKATAAVTLPTSESTVVASAAPPSLVVDTAAAKTAPDKK